ncbi:MAG: hypothetical protein IJ325_06120 [Clostridia bacterium]|nr:hypothetical protein [Clostridia bacterium]
MCAYIFDAEKDEVSVFEPGDYVFSSDSENESYQYGPGYSQTMFDFANRKVYQFYTANYDSGIYILQWFTFDLETNTWTTSSLFQRFDIRGRVNYLYPFPDGNGGAYIVGQNGVPADEIANAVGYTGEISTSYVHETMYIFHIPDLTKMKNNTFTEIASPM